MVPNNQEIIDSVLPRGISNGANYRLVVNSAESKPIIKHNETRPEKGSEQLNITKTTFSPSREQINKRYIFDSRLWIDHKSYWLNISPLESHDCYQKFRLTASSFGTVIKKSNLSNEIAMTLMNNKQFDLNIKQTGVKESKPQDWYCLTRNVQVDEVHLVVPKWEPRICALNLNILGTDGIINIKNPVVMYDSLNNHMDKIDTGWRPPPFYHSHIREAYYAEIQGTMKITEKSFCDFIVYSSESNLSYVERIPFDQVYWDNILWPKIQNFLDNVMEPLVVEHQYSNLLHEESKITS
jgi:hypothetical protein